MPVRKSGFAWAPGAKEARMGRFAQARQLVAENVLRLSGPYLPRDTGRLAASGTALDGAVRWSAPYAAARYQKAGGRWAQQVKAAHMREIVHAAAKWMGGRDE